MKVLVTGVTGQLGYDVMQELKKRGHQAVGCARAAENPDFGTTAYVPLDITQPQQVEKLMQQVQPEAVIHCAAWTAVDAAEDEENKAAVEAVNAKGTAYLAKACQALDCKMLYTSTDYVFNGEGTTAWQPDFTGYEPLNFYGQSKLDGEKAVAQALTKFFIVRIAWVFGQHGNNFVKTMLRLAKTHKELRVVCDQIGRPTYTADLARLLVDMVESEKYGYYHATNEGPFISWYDFACAIFKEAGADVRVQPVTTAEYGLSKAKRPFNSRLDTSKLAAQGFTPLPDWPDALKRYIKQITATKEG